MKVIGILLISLALMIQGCESQDNTDATSGESGSDETTAESESSSRSLVEINRDIADDAIAAHLHSGIDYPVILADGADWMALEMGENTNLYLDRYGWFNGSFGGNFYFTPADKIHTKFFWEPWDGPISAVYFADLNSESASEIEVLEAFDNIAILGILNYTEDLGYTLYVVGNDYLRYR